MRRLLLILLIIVFTPRAYALETAASVVESVKAHWTGDLAAMRQEGVVRVLIPFSKTFYFIDDGVEKGLAIQGLREFEDHLNRGVKKEADKIRIVLIPVPRDRLIEGVADGVGDIAVGNLTITRDRLKKVDFSAPFLSGVRELVVTTKNRPDFEAIEDLSGLTIHTRASSSYFESLQKINTTLGEKGKPPIAVESVDEHIEDEDLLEMLHAGAIDAIVMDEHKANVWLSVFEDLKLHDKVPLRKDAEIGWAFRKNSPELADAINAFQKLAAQGTLLGNILLKRYYGNAEWIKNPREEAYLDELLELHQLFVEMGEKYRIDPLLLAALSFQESKFNNNARSRVGAVGIMQVLPSTAADPNVGIENITQLRNNVEAGTKYIRFMADHHFSEGDTPDDQKILMALASYNAGPNRIERLRLKASDPDKWFQSVEWEVAKTVGVEPVRYVKNIYIYYVIFRELLASDEIRARLIAGKPQ